jgi:hypothetical protein
MTNKLNYWTELSVQYANQKNYLDDLFSVYPTIPDGIREIDEEKWNSVEKAFNENNNLKLIESLLKLDLFPIKDSYVAYLKRDKSSIERNPQTINRLCGRLYEMELNGIFKNCSEPKETNRQIGPLFKRWIQKNTIGVPLLDRSSFTSSNENSILIGSDRELQDFATNQLGYRRDKGLDFIGKFNGKHVIGEAKFLTDFGGHQNAQFSDAISTIEDEYVQSEKIAILDGVLYIKGNHKMYKYLQNNPNHIILSSLLLREFLFQL